jgi:hypothetical protein
MNRDYVLFHLQEGLEELERTIRDLQAEPEYGQPEFAVAMEHLYHHLNTAWNARNASDHEAQECAQANFTRWHQFPTDIELDDGAGA